MSLQYGLNVRTGSKPHTSSSNSASAPPARPNKLAQAFAAEEAEEEDSNNDPLKSKSAKHHLPLHLLASSSSSSSRLSSKHAIDPALLDFDSYVPSSSSSSSSSTSTSTCAPLPLPPAKSQYITSLLSNAAIRSKEREYHNERRLQKEMEEQEKELEKRGQKLEKFITSDYKDKLEQERKWKREEEQKEQSQEERRMERQDDDRGRGGRGGGGGGRAMQEANFVRNVMSGKRENELPRKATEAQSTGIEEKSIAAASSSNERQQRTVNSTDVANSAISLSSTLSSASDLIQSDPNTVSLLSREEKIAAARARYFERARKREEQEIEEERKRGKL